MRGIIAAFFSVAAAVSAAAQDFPKQSLRIIVPFPPGGAVDILSRAIAPKLQEAFKQSVIIENRAGNAGVIGMQAVARAAPDGHTLGIGTLSSLAIGPALSKNMGYDARKDFSLVAMMTEVHIVMVTSPSLPGNSLAELVDWAKKNPTKMNYSSNGAGSSGHIVGELLKRKFGFEAAHVPQGGDTPIINSLMGDHVQLGIIAAPPTEPFVRDKKIKAVAVTSARRSPVLPEVPTLTELGLPDIVASTWFSFVTPAGVPRTVIESLNREINRAMRDPDVARIFKNGGLEPIFMSVPEYEAFVKSEQDKWGEIVKTLGVSVDQ